MIPPRYKEKASDQMQILAILNRRLKEAHKINVVYLGPGSVFFKISI